ncbi:MAG: type III-B CRISPR module RAMP protein Cmr1 [Candidatus Methanomethyliaceae archaeon]
MQSPASALEWQFKALTDIWTGNLDRHGNRLIPTGLIGSIRWWLEILVRGLGGKACDPTSPERCPGHNKKPTEPGHRCVVCELFGCTGWARKFRLMILDSQGNVIQGQIRANTEFTLRFIPLRPIRDEEWCLLDLTLRLIADYGAIGGKTVLKPSDEWGLADLGAEDFEEQNAQVRVRHARQSLPLREGDIIKEVGNRDIYTLSDLQSELLGKQHGERIEVTVLRGEQGSWIEKQMECWIGKRHHQDFGLISYEQGPPHWKCEKSCEHLKNYVAQPQWRKAPHTYDEQGCRHDFSWASLENFWCVKGRYLARQDADKSTFNAVIGRKQPKNEAQELEQDNDINRWLAGRQQESKKVFSFKHPEEGGRTFGFVKPPTVDFEKIKTRLGNVWTGFNSNNEFKDGRVILDELCRQKDSPHGGTP